MKKNKIIIAYIFSIAVLIGATIFCFQKAFVSNSSDDKNAETIQEWDDQGQEGDINNIVEYNHHVETEPVTSKVSESSTVSVDEVVSATETEASSVVIEDPPLTLNGFNCLLDLSETLDIDKSNPSEFHYTDDAGRKVVLSLKNDSFENCKNNIVNLANSRNADITEEILTFSSTRVYDLPAINFNKYTMLYEENENLIYEYSLISQATDDIVYEVDITSPSAIDFDSMFFSVLDYQISPIE